jgi:hypothetical protein
MGVIAASGMMYPVYSDAAVAGSVAMTGHSAAGRVMMLRARSTNDMKRPLSISMRAGMRPEGNPDV